MNLRTLVWKELRQRPMAAVASGMAILLGVAALVAIRHVVVASELEIGRQMASLGANVLILPKDGSVQNYYAADRQSSTLPESHVSRILMEALPGVERLSPKLATTVELAGKEITLTGILPQSEFQTATWQSLKLFTRKHVGCKNGCGARPVDDSPEALATQRTIQQLGEHDLIVGADVAEAIGLIPAQKLFLLGEAFTTLAVLPRTGTVDDNRLFAHLHTVQRLTKAGEVVSAIEVLGCCEDAAGKLVPQLAELLPDAKVVTISHVVEAQVNVNQSMARMSLFVAITVVLVGGISVATTVSMNVRERRREVGTLMALGASPRYVAAIFLLKAIWLGLAAGTIGALIGLAVAVWGGPQWALANVEPLPGLTAGAIGAALAVSLVAAYWPARRAARMDPCVCFQEI
jgi:putative ABC transport system permease protein